MHYEAGSFMYACMIFSDTLMVARKFLDLAWREQHQSSP